MSWLDKLFGGGYKRIAIGGVQLAPEATLNFASGASGADDPLRGQTNVTINPGTTLTQVVPSGGAVTVGVFQRAWVDASSGTVSVTPPAVAVGAQWGVVDSHRPGGSFSKTQYASIANASNNIEDPGDPGVFTNNPVKVVQPTASIVWEGDPSGSVYKVVAS